MCIVYTTFSVVIWSSHLLVIVRKSVGAFMSTIGVTAVGQKSACLLHCSPKPSGEVPPHRFCPGQCRSCLECDPSRGSPATNHSQTLVHHFRSTLASYPIKPEQLPYELGLRDNCSRKRSEVTRGLERLNTHGLHSVGIYLHLIHKQSDVKHTSQTRQQ